MVTSVLQGLQIVVDATDRVVSRTTANMEIVTGSEFFDIYYFIVRDDGIESQGGFGGVQEIRLNGLHIPANGQAGGLGDGQPRLALVELEFANGTASTVIMWATPTAGGNESYSFFLLAGAPLPATGPLSLVQAWFDSVTDVETPTGEFAPDAALSAPTFDSFTAFTYNDSATIVEERFGRYRLGLGDDTLNGYDGTDGSFGTRQTVDYQYLALDESGIRVDTFEGDEQIYGGAGNDLIRGRGGNDFISGDGGNDSLYAGTTANFRSDVLFGGDGNDELFGAVAESADVYTGRLNGDAGSDRIFGGNGIEDIGGGDGNDTIVAGDGGDYVSGNAGRDRISGGRGNDLILGHAGNDSIAGEAGSDQLYGGADNDTIAGGAGRDLLIGGTGADRFVFAAGSARDMVLDLNIAEGDRLQFAASLLGTGIDTAQEIVAEYGSLDAAGLRLTFDSGDSIRLAGLTDLNALAAGILIG